MEACVHTGIKNKNFTISKTFFSQIITYKLARKDFGFVRYKFAFARSKNCDTNSRLCEKKSEL